MPKNVYDLMKELAGFNMDNLMIIRVFETWEKEGADDRMSNKKKIDGESLIKILKSAFESSPGATKNDAVKKYLRMLCVLYLKDNNGATENLYENILKKSGINDSKAILSDAGVAVPEFTSRDSYVQTISKFIDDAIKKEAKQILKKKSGVYELVEECGNSDECEKNIKEFCGKLKEGGKKTLVQKLSLIAEVCKYADKSDCLDSAKHISKWILEAKTIK